MYPGEGLVGVVYIGLNDAINTPMLLSWLYAYSTTQDVRDSMPKL